MKVIWRRKRLFAKKWWILERKFSALILLSRNDQFCFTSFMIDCFKFLCQPIYLSSRRLIYFHFKNRFHFYLCLFINFINPDWLLFSLVIQMRSRTLAHSFILNRLSYLIFRSLHSLFVSLVQIFILFVFADVSRGITFTFSGRWTAGGSAEDHRCIEKGWHANAAVAEQGYVREYGVSSESKCIRILICDKLNLCAN